MVRSTAAERTSERRRPFGLILAALDFGRRRRSNAEEANTRKRRFGTFFRRYGTTPFAGWCAAMASPALEGAREACAARRGRYVVLGSSTGTLCFYGAAFGFDVRGVDVLAPLVAVARGFAAKHPALGVGEDAFLCGDVRDAETCAPVVRGAALVVVCSSCWDVGLRDAYAELLERELAAGSVVLDYSSTLDGRLGFHKLSELSAPVSWAPDDNATLHAYARVVGYASPTK